MGWFESSLSNSSKRKGRLALATWRVMAAGLCSSAAIMGCGSEKPQAGEEKPVAIESGNLKLSLTGVSPAGAVYRLRNAEFRISSYYGGYETTVSTEDDPESTFIYLEIPAGEYSVYLLPGYTVEQVNGGSGTGGMGTGGPVGTTGPATPTTPPTTTAAPPPDVSTSVVEDNVHAFARAGEWPSQGSAPERAVRDSAPDSIDGGAPEVTEGPATTEPVSVDGGTIDTGGETTDGLSFELISENPAYAYVYPYSLSYVNFSFLVNGGVVNTGSGALIIGASFYEDDPYAYTCPGDDPYEPNDFYSPAPITTDETTYAFSCIFEDDMYIFDAPVPEGQLFRINVSFDPSVADINIEYGTADYEYLGGSFGVEGTESVVGVSNGGAYLLHVINYGPESAPYQIHFDSDFASANSCCETSDEPGCSDAGVLACLCQIDSVCCTGSYDEVCAQEAIAECGAQCEQPEPTSTCCEAAPEPGCLDENVEVCVCDIDPTCCTSTFDQNCANLAQGQCGASCGGAE